MKFLVAWGYEVFFVSMIFGWGIADITSKLGLRFVWAFILGGILIIGHGIGMGIFGSLILEHGKLKTPEEKHMIHPMTDLTP